MYELIVVFFVRRMCIFGFEFGMSFFMFFEFGVCFGIWDGIFGRVGCLCVYRYDGVM